MFDNDFDGKVKMTAGNVEGGRRGVRPFCADSLARGRGAKQRWIGQAKS